MENLENIVFTEEELSIVIDFVKDKDRICMTELRTHFNKSYNWAMCIMEILEELQIVGEFMGEKERVVIKTES